MDSGASDLTTLIEKWQTGDSDAANKLLERVYPELKRLAGAMLKNERREHTLEPSALVNELYLKIARSCQIDVRNRTQFFALAAQSLRNILVDYARQHRATKRGGGDFVITLSGAKLGSENKTEDLLSIDQALKQLQELDPRAAQIVELRFFGGLNEEEIAKTMGLSRNTIQRDWKAARAWLNKQLFSQRVHD